MRDRLKKARVDDNDVAKSGTQQAIRWLSGTTGGAGRALGYIASLPGINNPFVRRVAS